MEKSVLLKRYCSRLVAMERRAVLTKESYRHEIKRFLDFLETKEISLGDADAGFLNAKSSVAAGLATVTVTSFVPVSVPLDTVKRKIYVPAVLKNSSVNDSSGETIEACTGPETCSQR